MADKEKLNNLNENDVENEELKVENRTEEPKENIKENEEPQSTDTKIDFVKTKNKKEKEQNEKTKKQVSHKGAFPVGLLVVILALAGLCSIIYFAVTGIGSAVTKNKNYDEYNKLLTPVVLIDPNTFDDITKADMNELIEMSLWSLLKSDITPDKYTGDGNGLTIPKADVEAEFIKLFGTEIAPSHSTVEGYGYVFTYDTKAEKYHIPLTGIVPIYTPQVVDKKTTSDTIILTVACLPGDAWQQGNDGQMVPPAPDKYIKITLREKDGAKFISAIQNTASPEIAPEETVTESTTVNKDLIAQAEQVAAESTTVPAESTTGETTTETTKAA